MLRTFRCYDKFQDKQFLYRKTRITFYLYNNNNNKNLVYNLQPSCLFSSQINLTELEILLNKSNQISSRRKKKERNNTHFIKQLFRLQICVFLLKKIGRSSAMGVYTCRIETTEQLCFLRNVMI